MDQSNLQQQQQESHYEFLDLSDVDDDERSRLSTALLGQRSAVESSPRSTPPPAAPTPPQPSSSSSLIIIQHQQQQRNQQSIIAQDYRQQIAHSTAKRINETNFNDRTTQAAAAATETTVAAPTTLAVETINSLPDEILNENGGGDKISNLSKDAVAPNRVTRHKTPKTTNEILKQCKKQHQYLNDPATAVNVNKYDYSDDDIANNDDDDDDDDDIDIDDAIPRVFVNQNQPEMAYVIHHLQNSDERQLQLKQQQQQQEQLQQWQPRREQNLPSSTSRSRSTSCHKTFANQTIIGTQIIMSPHTATSHLQQQQQQQQHQQSSVNSAGSGSNNAGGNNNTANNQQQQQQQPNTHLGAVAQNQIYGHQQHPQQNYMPQTGGVYQMLQTGGGGGLPPPNVYVSNVPASNVHGYMTPHAAPMQHYMSATAPPFIPAAEMQQQQQQQQQLQANNGSTAIVVGTMEQLQQSQATSSSSQQANSNSHNRGGIRRARGRSNGMQHRRGEYITRQIPLDQQQQQQIVDAQQQQQQPPQQPQQPQQQQSQQNQQHHQQQQHMQQPQPNYAPFFVNPYGIYSQPVQLGFSSAQHATGTPLYATNQIPMYAPAPASYYSYPPGTSLVYPSMVPPEYSMIEGGGGGGGKPDDQSPDGIPTTTPSVHGIPQLWHPAQMWHQGIPPHQGGGQFHEEYEIGDDYNYNQLEQISPHMISPIYHSKDDQYHSHHHHQQQQHQQHQQQQHEYLMGEHQQQQPSVPGQPSPLHQQAHLSPHPEHHVQLHPHLHQHQQQQQQQQQQHHHQQQQQQQHHQQQLHHHQQHQQQQQQQHQHHQQPHHPSQPTHLLMPMVLQPGTNDQYIIPTTPVTVDTSIHSGDESSPNSNHILQTEPIILVDNINNNNDIDKESILPPQSAILVVNTAVTGHGVGIDDVTHSSMISPVVYTNNSNNNNNNNNNVSPVSTSSLSSYPSSSDIILNQPPQTPPTPNVNTPPVVFISPTIIQSPTTTIQPQQMHTFVGGDSLNENPIQVVGQQQTVAHQTHLPVVMSTEELDELVNSTSDKLIIQNNYSQKTIVNVANSKINITPSGGGGGGVTESAVTASTTTNPNITNSNTQQWNKKNTANVSVSAVPMSVSPTQQTKSLPKQKQQQQAQQKQNITRINSAAGTATTPINDSNSQQQQKNQKPFVPKPDEQSQQTNKDVKSTINELTSSTTTTTTIKATSSIATTALPHQFQQQQPQIEIRSSSKQVEVIPQQLLINKDQMTTAVVDLPKNTMDNTVSSEVHPLVQQHHHLQTSQSQQKSASSAAAPATISWAGLFSSQTTYASRNHQVAASSSPSSSTVAAETTSKLSTVKNFPNETTIATSNIIQNTTAINEQQLSAQLNVPQHLQQQQQQQHTQAAPAALSVVTETVSNTSTAVLSSSVASSTQITNINNDTTSINTGSIATNATNNTATKIMSYSAASAQGLPVSSTTHLNKQTKNPVKSTITTNNSSQKPSDEIASIKLGEFFQKYKIDNNGISLRPRGLINRSNYCYMNASLQALVACSPFYNLIKSIPQQPVYALRSKTTTPTIDAMVELVNEFSNLPPGSRLQTRRGDKGYHHKKEADVMYDLACDPPFEPTTIHKLWNSSRSVNEGRQEDAEEFLGYILNKLNDEMLELKKLVEKPQPPPVANGDVNGTGNDGADDGDEWQLIGNKNKGTVTRVTDFGRTPLSDIFRGELRSRLQREGDCSKDDMQPFFTLQLNIEKSASVKEALENFVNKDQLEGLTCSKTNQEVMAWQQMTLGKLPICLILHLKWFDFKLDGCTKILKTVEFPIDLKIDSKIVSSKKYSQKQKHYKLFAVVYHDGKEASKGHYITDAYHFGYSYWLRYDDSSVKPISESMVLHPYAPRVPYLLYYRRSDTIANPTTIGNGGGGSDSGGGGGGGGGGGSGNTRTSGGNNNQNTSTTSSQSSSSSSTSHHHHQLQQQQQQTNQQQQHHHQHHHNQRHH